MILVIVKAPVVPRAYRALVPECRGLKCKKVFQIVLIIWGSKGAPRGGSFWVVLTY